MTELDPLHDLVLDTRRVDRKQLADLLRGRVWLNLDARTFVLDASARQNTTIAHRIAVALLAQKALSILLNDEEHPDGLTPRELETFIGAKGGSIRPALKQLTGAGVVCKIGARYAVPAHAFDTLKERIREDQNVR